VRIVYVLPLRRGLALSQFERNKVNVAPNHNLLHWRPPHVNGVGFPEVGSYEIHGMSPMIYRSVPHHRIRYILGAIGEGCRRLRRSPMRELDSMDYVFIASDETVRAGHLSNPVPDDRLHLMVYCYCDWGSEGEDSPAQRRVDYLNQNDVRNWAHDPAQHIGQMLPENYSTTDLLIGRVVIQTMSVRMISLIYPSRPPASQALSMEVRSS